MSDDTSKSLDILPTRRRKIRYKIPKLTPKQKRIILLQEEAKKKREELADLKRQLEKPRRAAAKKELAARRLSEVISGEHKTTTKDNNIVSLDNVPTELIKEVLDEDVNVVFRPNPGPQTDFLAATEKEVFFGGARGGAKTYSLIVDPLRYCNKETARALLLRRTMPELRDIINHTLRLYPKAYPGAKWRDQEKEWRFPSGARIEFGYAENETDALRYQGQAYTYIGVDELPQFPSPDVWNLLKGSLRSVDPEIPTFMRATGNPGNIGSLWVKEMFIDPAEPNTTFFVPIDPNDPNTDNISRRYIPSKLSDNPYLTKTVEYRNMLLSLPEIKRKQWLDGLWDVYEGVAFPEFNRDIHICHPFKLDDNMVRFRSCDWGFSSPFCVLWMAVDYDNTIYVYREYYGKGVPPDTFAQKIMDMEWGEPIQYGVMDSSVWSRRGDIGPTIVDTMREYGCRWKPSDRSSGSRVAGWNELHRRLAETLDAFGNKTAKIKIFNTCRNLIRTLPMAPTDKNDPEDIDTKCEDHALDALRYGIMSRPIDPMRLQYYKQQLSQEQWRPSNDRIGY